MTLFERADWPAPAGVQAVQTLRGGGVSLPPYDSLNLAEHSGDDAVAVAANRARLAEALQLPQAPRWLRQVHGTNVIDAAAPAASPPVADASVSDRAGVVCAILTADCLPVLFCSDDGQWIGAAHAGWRGLADGVLEALLARAPQAPSRLLAWLGAAIGPRHFEVGPEVREVFVRAHGEDAAAFAAGEGDRWFADLYALARARLRRAGLERVYGGTHCTYAESERYYSFRRACHQHRPETGRMASLIWRSLPG